MADTFINLLMKSAMVMFQKFVCFNVFCFGPSVGRDFDYKFRTSIGYPNSPIGEKHDKCISGR